jgi:hypothetical protein
MGKARVSDPLTSHEAGRSVRNVTLTQEYVLKALRRPRTGDELVEAYRALKGAPYASESGIRSRRKELEERGLVRVVGSVTLESGRRGQLWQVAK